MKVILAVMCTTYAVVKIRPEKNSGQYGNKWNKVRMFINQCS